MENLTGRRLQILDPHCSKWVGLMLVGCVFITAAILSWRRWPDLLVDFGMQLYLPWRISAGEVLYRDLNYLTGGPFSQYFNALLFKIFGVSFRTLIVANLAITAGMVVLIYRRFLAVADWLTATMICLGIVLVFAFQHSGRIGNYNYVAPYCHEIFHGLVLSILVVVWLSDWIDRRQTRFALAAGFGSGLVFLTKPDVFLALMVCVAAVICLVGFRHRANFAVKSALAFSGAGLIPLLAFFAFFLRMEDWQTSLRSVMGAWVPLWHTSITRDPFYQWCMGLDTPFLHLGRMAEWFAGIVALTAFYVLTFRIGMKLELKRFKLAGMFGLLVLVSLALALVVNWDECGRPLLLLSLCTGALLAANYRNPACGPATFPLLWSVFGLALLAKLGFFTRISHYGFALAMPAFVGAVYLLVWQLPVLLQQRYQTRFDWFRVLICLVLVTGFVRLFLQSESYYRQKTVAVGTGGDRIMAYDSVRDPFHGNVETALSWIETNVPPEATLAVLPEGVMINYLSRRVNPTPCLVWVPPVMAVFGQAAMTSAFEERCPDYTVIMARNTTEFGVGFFGYSRDYGTGLMQWIDGHYDRVYPLPGPAGPPAGDQPFFAELQILKRRPPVSPEGKN